MNFDRKLLGKAKKEMWKEFVSQNIFPINRDVGMMVWRTAEQPWEDVLKKDAQDTVILRKGK